MKNSIETTVVAKAWKDPEFKKKLLQDPNKTVNEFIKERNPKAQIGQVKFKVVECDQHTVVIAIPPAPTHSQTLDEHELEKMAAGYGQSETPYTDQCVIL